MIVSSEFSIVVFTLFPINEWIDTDSLSIALSSENFMFIYSNAGLG